MARNHGSDLLAPFSKLVAPVFLPPSLRLRLIAPTPSLCRERAFLKGDVPITGGGEYVQGLSYEEMATLLNTDVDDLGLMEEIYDTAFKIKERIYGNRIVLFAPLYLANYCINDCQYCAFRVKNDGIER